MKFYRIFKKILQDFDAILQDFKSQKEDGDSKISSLEVKSSKSLILELISTDFSGLLSQVLNSKLRVSNCTARSVQYFSV